MEMSALEQGPNDSSLLMPSHELNRLCTFARLSMSSPAIAYATILAHDGFSYSVESNLIACYECGCFFSLDDFRPRDENPVFRHLRKSPHCSSARRKNEAALRPLSESMLRQMNAATAESFLLDENPRIASCDMTDNVSEFPEFIRTCHSAVNRAARRHVLSSIGDTADRFGCMTAAMFDPANPDFDLLRRETVRLGTFRDFPAAARAYVTPAELARGGFFHVGPNDCVCCAFCRNHLRNWEPNDVVDAEHRRHFPDCPFVRGIPVGNVAKEDDVACKVTIVGRGDDDGGGVDYTEVPERNAGVVHPVVVAAGTSQISARGPTDVLPVVHPPAGTDPHLVRGGGISLVETGGRGILNRPAARVAFQPSNPPKHPEFAEPTVRFRTFQAPGVVIPAGQNVSALVDAGFYHIGPHDNVKCFYCDLELKNFESTDEPWLEHAKWFPRCTHLQQHKTAEFIRHAQMQRSAYLHEQGVRLQQRPLSSLNRYDVTSLTSLDVSSATNSSIVGHVGRTPYTTDGTGAPPREGHGADTEPPSEAAAPPSGATGPSGGASVPPTVASGPGTGPAALTGGAETASGAATMASGGAQHGDRQMTASAGANENLPPAKPQARKNKRTDLAVASNIVDGASTENVDTKPDDDITADLADDPEVDELLEENRQLRNARTCKVCMDGDLNVVFLPCGHLVCCEACAPELRVCAICRSLIRGTVKIFLT